MKILVTGAAGFIATSLIPKLVAQNHQVVGVDSLVSQTTNQQFTENICSHHFFDINDSGRLEELLSGVDVVFHLAAKGNVIESVENPLANFNSNVSSTLSLLEAMRNKGCQKIIFSSTGGALMGDACPPVNESTLPKPISPYGASKLACEGYLSAYMGSYGFSSIVLRFGNVYGPFSSHKVGVINKWIRALFESNDLVIYGDGTASRDYIHVDDLTNGLMLALERLARFVAPTLETYHLANHSEITLGQLSEILLGCSLEEKLSSNIIHRPARTGEVSRNFADITLARNNLGFVPKVKFVDGISDLYKWIGSNEYKK